VGLQRQITAAFLSQAVELDVGATYFSVYKLNLSSVTK
jgi:hypothetical protein